MNKAMTGTAVALLATGMLSGGNALAGGVQDSGYFAAEIGSSTLNASAADYDSFARRVVGGGATVLESRLDRRDTGWSLVLYGVQKGYFGMEFGYQKLGTMSYEGTLGVNEGGDQIQLPVHIGISSRGWSASALGVLPLGDRVQLEGRAGAYFGKSRTSASFPVEDVGTVRLSDKDSGVSAMLGGSVVLSVGDFSAVSLGYTWFNDVAGKNLGRVSLGVRMVLRDH